MNNHVLKRDNNQEDLQHFFHRELISIFEHLKELNKNEQSPIKISKEAKSIRSQILDWMSEVLLKLSCSQVTFFIAVDIFDKVCRFYNYKVKVEDFHLIAVASIFISIKYNEIKQLNLKDFLMHVCHNKFTKKDLIAAEILILKKLNFKIPNNKFEDFSYIIINKLESYFTPGCSELLLKISLVLYKLVMLNHGTLEKYDNKIIYSAIIFLSVGILERQLSEADEIKDAMLRIFVLFGIPSRRINKCSSQLYKMFYNCMQLKEIVYIPKELANYK